MACERQFPPSSVWVPEIRPSGLAAWPTEPSHWPVFSLWILKHKNLSGPNICSIAILPNNVTSVVLSAPLPLSRSLLAVSCEFSSLREKSLFWLCRCLLGPKTVLYPAGAQ